MFNKKLTEQDIINGCIQGSEKHCRILYEKFFSVMFYSCRRYCSSDYDAEELVQQGFILIFQNLKKFQNRGSFEGWMKHIMINNAINYYRKEKRYATMITVHDSNDVQLEDYQYDILSKLSSDEIIAHVNRLPELYKTVFCLHVIDGYSHKEIADILNLKESSSRSALTRAKNKLKQTLSFELKINEYSYG